MDETLKAIRLLHQVIIALSAALLAFALSPNEIPQLDAALKELRSLRDLDPIYYYGWGGQATSVSESASQRPHFEALVAPVLSLPLGDKFTLEPAFYAEWPDKAAPLTGWEQFFMEGSWMESYSPGVDDPEFKKNLQAMVAEMRDEQPKASTLSSARFVLPDDKSMAGDHPDSDFFQRVAKTRVVKGSGTVWLTLQYPGKLSMTRSHALPVGIGQTSGGKAGYARKWLEAEPGKYEEIFGKNRADFLPAAHVYWIELKALSIADADAYLAKRRAAAPHTVTLWTVTVDTALLVWLGPLVTLLFISYLGVHILHMRLFCPSKGTQIQEFPWVGLFGDWVSGGLLLLTLFALPLAANVTVLIRTFDHTRWESYLGLIFLGGLVLMLVRLGSLIRQLQKDIQLTNKPGEPDPSLIEPS